MFILCTLRAFESDVGETLRIYGITNALAAAGQEVTLISNAVRHEAFHPAVRHIPIGCMLAEKRRLQALASLLPAGQVVKRFPRLFGRLAEAMVRAGASRRTVFFFDYLDNTIGYLLQQTGVIGGYINDVHGIAPVEFEYNRRLSAHPIRKVWNRLRESGARRLDRKVFAHGEGFLFGSAAMQDYFRQHYKMRGRSLVLPYLLDANALKPSPEASKVAALKEQCGLCAGDFVFMFVGTYKATAGVEDLLAAFETLQQGADRVQLLLVGDGMTRRHCEVQAKRMVESGAVQFLEPVPYAVLPAYYAMADVIVCPDRDNPFSQYVVHIKYLDALASGKLVVNGRFKSVAALNGGEPLSLLFTPSNAADLHQTLNRAFSQHARCLEQYGFAKDYVREQMTYVAAVPALVAMNEG